MTYSSIVPSEMTNHELKAICGDLQTSKNWNLPYATIKLKNGCEYRVDVKDIKDYQREFQTECGALRMHP